MFSCGFKHWQLNLKSSTAILFFLCTNVIVQNVSFVQSLYTAIVSDTTGKVDLNGSQFLNTSMTKHSIEAEHLFPRGVYIQFQRVLSPTAYAFTNCVFNNNILQKAVHSVNTIKNGFALGGGLAAHFMNSSQGVSLLIENCQFSSNHAHNGAGIGIHFQEMQFFQQLCSSWLGSCENTLKDRT